MSRTFPDGLVGLLSTILILVRCALIRRMEETDKLLDRYQQWASGKEVPPGPGVLNRPQREAVREVVNSEGELAD